MDDAYRLPRHAWPHRYELELRPDLESARFDGAVAIDVEVIEASDRLVLNAVDLELGRASLLHPDGSILTPEVSMDEPNQMAVLHFERRLEPGGYRLSVDFSGSLNDRLRGFYRSTFRDHDGRERSIATTQFESSDARRAFPCWDEPEFKAVFSVTLVVEAGLTGLSNGPLLESQRRDDGTVEMHFGETMKMSTYLVAFIVGPYELTEPDVVDGVPVRIATVPGKQDLTRFAHEVARHSLTFLAGYFEIPYPAAKLDHVAVPDFAFGAMENLGCVTYRESLLLADPRTAAHTELQRVASVVAHETAHMWFGDLVTMKWWNGIWLNEAFATFMEVTTADHFRPEWQMWTAFGAGKAAALSVDGLVATRPVEFAVGCPDEAEGMFDVLTYQKGGSVLKMLEQYLGAEVFRKGIAHYLATHAYGNTETADLWDAIETVSGEPVRAIMETWILQRGYPLVSVSRGSDPSTVVLRQKRFLYQGEAASGATAAAGGGAGGGPEASAQLWAVPVHLRASVNGTVHHERVLLDGEEASFTFAGPVDWVVVNDGAWGYYRTRYSDDLWPRLAQADPGSVLTPLEKLQLVGDAWAAVVAGDAPLETWAAVAAAVSADPDPDVWGAIAASLHLLGLIGDKPDLTALQALAERLARPAWERVGWEGSPDESDRTATARSRIVSVMVEQARDEKVEAEARRRFRSHLAGAEADEADLAPDLVGAAARIEVGFGGPEGWQEVLDAYRRSEDPQDRLRYLHALAETPLEDLRRRTLELMLGPDVRSQDAPFVIASLLGRPGAAPAVWDWIEANWDVISTRIPSSLLIRILEGAAVVTDTDVAERIRGFCRSAGLAITPIRLTQVLERMDVNLAFAARLRGTMAAALA